MDDKIKEKIKLLREGFIKKLPEKVESIESVWMKFNEKGDQENAKSLKLLVHNLRGTSATYECPGISKIAEKIENELNRSAVNHQEVERLMTQLRLELLNY